MENFNQFLQTKNLSKTTIEIYERYVNAFLNWYKIDALNCTKKDILNYLSFLRTEKNYQNITRRNNLLAINYYFTFLLKTEQIKSNPTAFIKIRGTKKQQLYHIFTFDELNQITDNFYNVFVKNYDDKHIPKNQQQQAKLCKQRNYVMLQLLINQGLQTNELQKIQLNDIDLNKAKIFIKGGNKSNERNINLNASQIGSLMIYLQNVRPKLLEYFTTTTEQLFLPLPITSKRKTSNLNLMHTFKPLSKQTKTLNKDFLNFKQIRASVITYWIQTLGLRKAQYFAGHRYISSTENYLPNDLKSLTEDIEKFNPF